MCILQDHDTCTCYEMVMQCDVKWYNGWINELVEFLRLSCESYLWCGFMQEIEEKILDRKETCWSYHLKWAWNI
jgi:hypothetical protein